MDQMAETAYADVRDAILGLRSTVLEGRSLVPTLRDYLKAFGLQHGLKTALRAAPGVEASLSPQVEVQLIQVVQETLTNVRKHARATQALVSMGAEGEGVCITVENDGRGFDPQAVARRGGGHFGLATMRERAESVGGRLEVDSAPGAGTRLSLWVPRTLTVERRPACSG
jgi:signal transduction histidine kinase